MILDVVYVCVKFGLKMWCVYWQVDIEYKVWFFDDFGVEDDEED